MKNNYWIFPLIILVLLLIAPYYRWEYTASKTTDNYVYKWRTDRWSGEKWVDIYRSNSFKSDRLAFNTGALTSNEATMLWNYAVVVVLIGTVLSWAVPIIKSRKKKELLKE